MRLWSLHPSLLDQKGLVALWREGLLAQKVLLGLTTGYRYHPQLKRFQASRNPIAAISTYLWSVVDEARARGYNFDASKLAMRRPRVLIVVTEGQLEFEREHLRNKLLLRDPKRARALKTPGIRCHPMLRVVAGDVELWEVGPTRRARPGDRSARAL
jgi:Pyrimidine dimer DNA glycosylase